VWYHEYMASLRLVVSMAEYNIHIILALSFIAAALVNTQLVRRFGIEAGALFVCLGVAAGPQGLEVSASWSPSTWSMLLSLLCGWVALKTGLACSLRSEGPLKPGALRAGSLYAILGMLGLALGSFAILKVTISAPFESAWLFAALIIAASGVATTPRTLQTLALKQSAEGPVSEAGISLARVAQSLVLLFISVFAAVAEPSTSFEGFRALTASERILAELLLGITLGFCTEVFLSQEGDKDRRLTTLVCLSLLASGLSVHLGLSPLLVNLVIGLSLANYGQRPEDRHHLAERLDRPARYILLMAMGAMWVPISSGAFWLVLISIFAARSAMLRIAGGAAGRAFGNEQAGFRFIGFTLVTQGSAAIALTLMYLHSLPQEVANLVLGVVMFLSLINDLWAPIAARAVLDEAGEIPSGFVEA